MKLYSSCKIIKASINEIWRMHDFNYQLPKENFNEYWDEECILHPTNSHCKIYDLFYIEFENEK